MGARGEAVGRVGGRDAGVVAAGARPSRRHLRARAEDHALVVTSYGLLQRDIEFPREVPWRGVALDEAQQIKNPQTAQARAARSLIADYRVALTGTPVENHLGDLWSIMEFLNPGFLGTLASFKRSFFVPIQVERDTDAVQRLRRATAPFMLRRVKTDRTIIEDLPEKFESKTYCSLTAEQASLYRAVLLDAEESLQQAEGIDRRGLILAVVTKLTQVCNHPAHFLGDNSAVGGRSGKLNRLTEMVEEVLAGDERALVFTRFVTMGDLLQQHLQGVFGTEVLFLHGGVPKAQRDRMVSDHADPALAPADPLPEDPDAFWGSAYEPDLARVVGAARVPVANAVIARRLGGFPFWTGSDPFLPTLETVYGAAASAALEVFLGDS